LESAIEQKKWPSLTLRVLLGTLNHYLNAEPLGKKKRCISLEEIHKSSKGIGISLAEIYISLFDLPISLREIHISLEEIHISPRESGMPQGIL